MTRSRLPIALGLVLFVGVSAAGSAAEPFRYPEAKHGLGELQYLNGVPVLLVQGEPAEIGEQIGVLAIKPAAALFDLSKQFLQSRGWERLYPVLLQTAAGLAAQFPPDHLTELEAAAKAAGRPRELLVFGNVAADLFKFGGCSAWIIDLARSTTGGPLFGRNLDWPPLGRLHEYCLVTVYRPKGKRAFAMVGYPGMFGAASGINDAGLALGTLEVRTWADGSPRFDPAGTPYMLLLRRVLEECGTTAEAEKLLRAAKRTTSFNLAICDKAGGAVFEVTANRLAVRTAVDGFCACTNHFRTDGLATDLQCRRYDTLDKARGQDKASVADVWKQLDAVNQGRATVQAMVFEPATTKLHLSFGAGPATRLPLREVALDKLFADGFGGKP
jgi:isopenicillin-N N-acyltransferase like protein